MNEKAGAHEARRIKWDDLEADHPIPLIERRRIHGERMTVARVLLQKGFKIEPHSHPEEQIAIVLSGKIRFILGKPGESKTVVVGGNELVHLPSGVPHGAEALEETLVLDLFSPAARESGLDRTRD